MQFHIGSCPNVNLYRNYFWIFNFIVGTHFCITKNIIYDKRWSKYDMIHWIMFLTNNLCRIRYRSLITFSKGCSTSISINKVRCWVRVSITSNKKCLLRFPLDLDFLIIFGFGLCIWSRIPEKLFSKHDSFIDIKSTLMHQISQGSLYGLNKS